MQWEKEYKATYYVYPDEDLAALYIFAEEHSVTALKVLLLDLAVDFYQDVAPRNSAVVKADARLPKTSPFLRLLVDAAYINGESKDFDPEQDGDQVDQDAGVSIALPGTFVMKVTQRHADADIARRATERTQLQRADYSLATEAPAGDANGSEAGGDAMD